MATVVSDIPEALQRQVQGMTTLLSLQEEGRKAEQFDAFCFVMVNHTRRLVPYAQAVFWHGSRSGRMTMAAVSGAPRFDPNAPQMVWYRKAIGVLAHLPGREKIQEVALDRLPEPLAREAVSWVHAHGLWVPLNHPRGGTLLGGLWLNRDRPWEEREQFLLGHLAQGYAESLAAWRKGVPVTGVGRRLVWVFVVVIFLAMIVVVFRVQVLQTALAPARVTAVDPSIVTAPMDGMVARFFVKPHDVVKKGDPLFALDDTELHHRLQLAREELALAQAQLRKVGQLAFAEKERLAEIATNKNLVREASAKVDFAAERLHRSQVQAAVDGVVVFSDPHDWLGRPVRLGERVLEIASPERVEMTIDLPVAEAMPFIMGGEVRLFLDIDPLHPVTGRLRFAAYEAIPNPEGRLVYLLKARLDPEVPLPRLGLKGTARIYGAEVSLFQWLFHRPIAALRRLVVL
ncbi:MAG: HlyD family efflux transporter periplasmic adaptor subunit [Magnetococcales bacterium]|nr:HlyD family efflux transporter periplasmic adaptor subunit [Magnetococcales bacterium]